VKWRENGVCSMAENNNGDGWKVFIISRRRKMSNEGG